MAPGHGEKIEETLRHPQLRDAVEGSVDQKELPISAELRGLEDPGKDHRDEEGRREAHDPPEHQGKGRFEPPLRSLPGSLRTDGAHAWARRQGEAKSKMPFA